MIYCINFHCLFPNYSVIQGLPYLDMVVHETLRMYSPVPLNNREATVDYHIPGTEVCPS